MKTLFIILVLLASMPINAQENIKRPDSFNYQSGVDAYNEGDFKNSMDFFTKELQQNPKNGYAMLWQAYIYNHYDMYGEAMNSVNNALKNLPKKDKQWNGIGYAFRARIQAELGDTVNALIDYEKAIKIANNPSFIFEKCNVLNEMGRYSDIDAEIKRAMDINPNNTVTWVYAGRNEDAKGNYDSALEKYTYAVKLDPNYSSAYSFRADTYITLHKYKEAAHDVISALSIDDDKKAFLQLYYLADSALAVIEPQLKTQQLKEPNDYAWSYYLGLMYAYKDKYTLAEQAFKEALKISEYEGRDKSLICQKLSETLNELGKYGEAFELTNTCLAIDSTDFRTWRDRVDICYNLGRSMEAIENANRAIACYPENASLYSQRARVYMYSNMLKNALDDINTAISLDGEESYYNLLKCEILKKKGDLSSAAEECRLVIERETAKPKDMQDLHSLVYAYARNSQRINALPIIEKQFNEITKNNEYDKACLYCILGDNDLAISHLQSALQLGFCEFVHIENDCDLDNIRETEQFKSLVSQYKDKYMNGVSVSDFSGYDFIEETTEVPFTKESGIYKVKCTINELPLHFYFDTGASDVTISSVEALFMLKNDYLKTTDIKGKEFYGTASGDIAEGTVVVLREVNFGGVELNNVKASVVHNQKAPLLLGQTVLSRLGKIEIDYGRNVLKITSKKRIK